MLNKGLNTAALMNIKIKVCSEHYQARLSPLLKRKLIIYLNTQLRNIELGKFSDEE